tara:strand:- start:88 stop:357 length:270 start_codon:yes stop_codon:yes gene_type:complete
MKKKHWIILVGLVLLLLLASGFITKYIEDAYFLFKGTGEDEPVIGGCAGVHMNYWQECCENWALENDIVHIQCVGNWTVEEGVCGWVCS